MTVKELKAYLKARGLVTKGRKSDLVARMTKHMRDMEEHTADFDASAGPSRDRDDTHGYHHALQKRLEQTTPLQKNATATSKHSASESELLPAASPIKKAKLVSPDNACKSMGHTATRTPPPKQVALATTANKVSVLPGRLKSLRRSSRKRRRRSSEAAQTQERNLTSSRVLTF